jgi:hypothetical protein
MRALLEDFARVAVPLGVTRISLGVNDDSRAALASMSGADVRTTVYVSEKDVFAIDWAEVEVGGVHFTAQSPARKPTETELADGSDWHEHRAQQTRTL